MQIAAHVGISGFAAAVPPYRVSLEAWSRWRGADADKTRAVVGEAFRVAGPGQSVYTLAADAAMALIRQHGIDPRQVGYLAVGTESSTDNATSAALVVRGMLDAALLAEGLPALARDVEVPEFKQACIGGLYALKGALRYVALEGAGRVAIVVAADLAEYALGSSGEPTQGAGAVAMLVQAQPRLLALDLQRAASASRYRALDFRKPFSRYVGQAPSDDGRPRDFPMFNGKYSTACYVDETLASLQAQAVGGGLRQGERAAWLHSLAAVFMHRPYHRMPVAAWSMAYVFALGQDAPHAAAAQAQLAALAGAAGVPLDAVQAEMASEPDLLGPALGGTLVEDAYPLTTQLVKALRETPLYREVVDDKMVLGSGVTRQLGNLYCASLPAWLAAGLEEAAQRGTALDGRDLLLVGYGSGDASEVLPAQVVPGWQAAALRTGWPAALAGAVDLTQAQYEALHEGHAAEGLAAPVPRGFAVERIGQAPHERGVELYRWHG
jgi:hydroxymethylglutaryl-CoA synthase